MADQNWQTLLGSFLSSLRGGKNTVDEIMDRSSPTQWLYNKAKKGVNSLYGSAFPTPVYRGVVGYTPEMNDLVNQGLPRWSTDLLSDIGNANQRINEGYAGMATQQENIAKAAKPSGGGAPGGTVSGIDIDNSDIMNQMLPAINRALSMADTHGAGKSTEMVINPNYYSVGSIGNRKVQQWIPRESEWQYGVNRGGAGKAAAMVGLANELLGNRAKLAATKMGNDAMIKAHQISAGPGYINANNETRALEEYLKKRTTKEEGSSIPPMYRGF